VKMVLVTRFIAILAYTLKVSQSFLKKSPEKIPLRLDTDLKWNKIALVLCGFLIYSSCFIAHRTSGPWKYWPFSGPVFSAHIGEFQNNTQLQTIAHVFLIC